MSEWLKSLLGCLLMISIAMQMLPGRKYEQYVRLFTGFLLLILVLQPVLKIRSADSFLENRISQFVEEQEALEKQIGKEGEAFLSQSEAVSEETTQIVEVEEIQQVEVSVGD